MLRFSKQQNLFTCYLIILAILGMLLVLFITSAHGPGISGDAIEYISTADSLGRGEGFTNFKGGPFILWPPLYPLVLAAVHGLIGLDTILAGQIFNAIAFGLNILLSGILARNYFPNTYLWPALVGFLSLFSPCFLAIAINFGSDSIFITIVLAFFTVCHAYQCNSRRNSIVIMLILAILAPLQRFLGVCIVIAGSLVVIHKNRKVRIRAIAATISFGMLASLPILAWVIGRNYFLNGSAFGPRHLQDAQYLSNVAYCANRILHWFIPINVLEQLPLWLIPAISLGILFMTARFRHWVAFIKRLWMTPNWPLWVFTAIYLLIIIFTMITLDHLDPYDDRLIAIVFTPTLIFLFTILQSLVIEPLQEKNLRYAKVIPVALIMIWLIYPVFSIWKQVTITRQKGVQTYNVYNKPFFLDELVANHLRDHPLQPGVPVYSNDPEAAYLLTRQVIRYSPQDLKNPSRTLSYLQTQYKDWPGTNLAYLIWFVEYRQLRDFFTPEELGEVADIEILVQSKKAGGVYLIRPHSAGE